VYRRVVTRADAPGKKCGVRRRVVTRADAPGKKCGVYRRVVTRADAPGKKCGVRRRVVTREDAPGKKCGVRRRVVTREDAPGKKCLVPSWSQVPSPVSMGQNFYLADLAKTQPELPVPRVAGARPDRGDVPREHPRDHSAFSSGGGRSSSSRPSL